MICGRSFSRVESVRGFANLSYILPKSIYFFQGLFHYRNLSYVRKMSGAKDHSHATDLHKKRRTVTAVWRPVSSQSSSYEDIEKHSVNIEPISEEAVPTPSTDVLQCNDQSEVEEKASVPSANVVVESLSQSQEILLEVKPVDSANQEQDKDDDTVEKHSMSMEVDAFLIHFIKGKGSSMQKQIEGEAGVKIVFPSSKKENSIVIEGTSMENVTKASEKIQSVLAEAIKSPKLDYSHFISLPLAIHPGLVEKLNAFQNSILANPEPGQDSNLDGDSNEDSSDDGEDKDEQLDGGLAVNLKAQDGDEHVKVQIDKIVVTSYPPKMPKSYDLGIDRSIFIRPKTVHLTVLMLKLWNKERVAAATEVLQSISLKVKDALDGRPVSVRLKGLECMRGSPAKARVVYAPVEEIGGEDRLLRACQVIIDAYIKAGLVLEKDAKHKLKLHATLMNVRHRKRKKWTRRFDLFDARSIFEKYGSEEWGEYLIREAHLSQRFVFDDKGYYHCCASIPFPEDMQIE